MSSKPLQYHRNLIFLVDVEFVHLLDIPENNKHYWTPCKLYI